MWVIGLLVVFIIILLIVKKKKGVKPVDECVCPDGTPCVDGVCEDPEPCAELKKLAILYKGKFLAPLEVVEIPYNTLVEFRVKGFDITGTKEACLEGDQVTWDRSCPCTYWTNHIGLINTVRTNNKTPNTKRSVWVNGPGGITFRWKVMVV